MMDETKPPSYQESVGAGPTYAPYTSDPSVPDINCGFESDDGYLKPPSAPVLDLLTQERAPLIELDEPLVEEDIRNACRLYASQYACYGNKFIRDMTIKKISNGYTFHYKLETFGEKRQFVHSSVAYYGQTIDGPQNGPAPAPWIVTVPEPQKFQDGQCKIEIPHTAVVGQCTKCEEIGRIQCISCLGRGGNNCSACAARSGRRRNDSCSKCYGTGRERCSLCTGTGQVKCDACLGHGKVKHFKLLIVTWKNHVDDFVSDTQNMPRLLVMGVTGKEVFEEECYKVFPISHAPDESVNLASSEFIAKHERECAQELVRTQRHILRAIPLTKVEYSWKNREGEFYVYGFQREIYFEDYPQQCCCTII